MTNPTPDDALLWARRKVALAYAGEASASFVAEMATGGNDNWVVLVTAEAFRAGQSHADAGLLAENARLLEALEDVMDTGFTGGPQGKRARAAIAAAKGAGK